MRRSQDIKPSEVVVSRSVSTNDSASFIFDTQGHASATVVAQVLDLMPVRGSKRASTWISDAVDGNGFVDIVLIGDSNTGFNQYGICNGLVHAMCTEGATQYASAMYEVWRGSDLSEHALPSSDGTNRKGMRSFATTADHALKQALDTSGGAAGGAPDTIKTNFSLGGSAIQGFGSVESNGLWVASGAGNKFSDFNLGMIAQNAGAAVGDCLEMTDALTYRLYYSSTDTGGSVVIRVQSATAGTTFQDTVSLANSASQLAYIENSTTIAAAARTNLQIYIAGGGVGSANAITGPGAFFWQTVYRDGASSGFAVQPFEYYGGRTLTQISTDVSRTASGWLKQYIKAIVQRQQAVASENRVIFWIQGGTNLDASATAARNSVQSIIDTVRSAWSAAGYAASELAFVMNVTHQVSDPDGLADRRAKIRELTQVNPDLTVVEPQLLESFAEADATKDSVHQTIAGYNRQCGRWIAAMLTHGASSVAASTITLEHSDTTAASGFSSLSGFSGGTDYTIAAPTSTSRPSVVYNVDMRGRKRYLRVSVKPGQLADVAAYCVLSDPNDSPISAADLSVPNRVIR